MTKVGVWILGISIVIGIGNGLVRKDPMALEIYKFADHTDRKSISDFAHRVRNFYGVLGFAWGLLACALLLFLLDS